MSGLLKGSFDEVDVFYSPEIVKDYVSNGVDFDLEYIVGSILEQFLDQTGYGDIVDLFFQLKGNERKAILLAHGSVFNDDWYYFDGERNLRVQCWIRANDGKYGALILCVCNPGLCEISSKQSVVLASNYIYSQARQNLGECKVELFLPGVGYIDDYVLDWHRNQLLRALELRKSL